MHVDGHGDDMKDSNLSQGACVWRCRHDHLPEIMRTTISGCGCRCTHCEVPRKIHVVIDVRIVECHASIHVVSGIHVVLCHPLIDYPLF